MKTTGRISKSCHALFFLFLFSGCEAAEVESHAKLYHFSGKTMGTSYSVRLVAESTGESPLFDLATVQQKVDQRLGEINRMMSTYDPESELSRFNRHEGDGWFEVSQETAMVVRFALKVAADSQGAFDPTVGPAVNLWGFGPGKDRKLPPTLADIDAARERIGYEKLEVRTAPPALRKSQSNLYVDLSAIAKGFGVDDISRLLKDLDFTNSMVEIGGEVRTRGSKPQKAPWRIGVEKPDSRGRKLQEIFELHDVALATSGDYRNFFERDGIRYSHTINPATARPVQHHLATVSVLADECLEADALATALLVMGDRLGYDWCVEREVAAMFLVREGDTLSQRVTPRFKKLTTSKAPAAESVQ